MLDHVILKPLPFDDQDRLIQLFEDHSFVSRNGREWDMAPANYRDWKRMNTSFEAMACFRGASFNLLGDEERLRIVGSCIRRTEMLADALGNKADRGAVVC